MLPNGITLREGSSTLRFKPSPPCYDLLARLQVSSDDEGSVVLVCPRVDTGHLYPEEASACVLSQLLQVGVWNTPAGSAEQSAGPAGGTGHLKWAATSLGRKAGGGGVRRGAEGGISACKHSKAALSMRLALQGASGLAKRGCT